ncbi:MAG: alanine--tRNA ligase [Planctomycetota bacterium]|nr:alanine--tRNA ligase [Planctomycetota bacterium]
MKKLSTDEIRRSFIDFFVERGHTEWPSDSLIPSDDPTLLFTGAGMNQFKDMFLGKGNLPFSRATTAQKCLRTGDLGNVGKTAYHQTFFEMMGNFSFGDYFKKEAIEWAFEWLTEVLEIPPKRLYFSVYEDDDEAYGHWKAVCEAAGLDPERRIFRLDAKENFWPADAPEKGPNGPCGPCSEIFFDQQHDPDDPEPLVDIAQEGSRFCEIWNLVFTQFDRRGVNVLEPLPQKNIDTGLGLERLAAVLQGVERNSDIDIFQPIMRRIESEFADGKHITDMDATSAQCVRRIADHVRSVSFCICDGAMPGNAERGYVVRRLIRRAFLDAAFLRGDYEYAGLSNIVEPVLETMGEAYPDLVKRCEFIREIISGEERDFVRTLNANRNRLNDTLKEAKSRNGVVDGQRAFKLFDTYGVPVEVMEDFFERHGVKLDREGFDAAVTRRREQSRKASKMKGDIFDLGPLGKALEVTTETKFTGYSELEATRLKPLMLFCGDEPVRKVKKGDKVVVVLDRTPFYAEAGGQVGDTGYLRKRVRANPCD